MKEKKEKVAYERNFSVQEFAFLQLQPSLYGEEVCGKDRKPSYEPQYLCYSIHFVYSGSGYIQYGKNEPIHVKKGEVFFLLPSQEITYYPDKKMPWHYAWITFSAINFPKILSRLGVSADSPKLTLPKNSAVEKLFKENLELASKHQELSEIINKSSLFKIIFELLKSVSDLQESRHVAEPDHVTKAQEFIERNYHRQELDLGMVAKHCNLNKAYFSRLFVKSVGVPFSNYLMELRIRKARLLFESGETSVKKVSYMVGFDSPYYFSKVFKSLNQSPPCPPSTFVAQVKERREQEKKKAEKPLSSKD